LVKYAQFKEGKIKYTDSGQGRVVVFLHGFLESHKMWRYYQNNLPSKIRSICIDLPGHGNSDNFGYNHSMELMAQSVKAVLKKEGVRKAILVGHSLGGYVALAFAELHPDIMKGLIMYFSSAAADSKEKKHNRNRTIKLVERNKASFVRNSIPLLFAEQNRKKHAKKIASLIKEANKMGVQSIIASLGGMRDRSDREIILKFAPFPIKYVSGDLDPVLPIEMLINQANIPNTASITVLKNTGHMGFIENKRESFVAVKEFIDTIY